MTERLSMWRASPQNEMKTKRMNAAVDLMATETHYKPKRVSGCASHSADFRSR